MFERFTDRARRVVVLAQEEARMLNHGYIGTEHLLLGLIHEGGGAAGPALESLSITLDDARAQVVSIVPRGQEPPTGHIPFTPRAKKILELSLREALDLGHNYIGPEHILLGIVREGQGVANQVLANLGANGHRVRAEATRFIQQGEGEAEEEAVIRLPPDVRLVGSPAQLAQVMRRLDRIDDRLASIERHLGIAARRTAGESGGPEEPGPAAQSGPPRESGPPEDPGPAGEAGSQAG
ncbi:MAG: Clp protease N-terminal domain-containing protein [Streptosporangiaceae bacterium]